jgi:hypothetical protein
MNRSQKFANPFYSLLLVAGIAFALTATAYGVMAFRERNAYAPLSTESAVAANVEHPLLTWMSQYGETALMAELAILAVCTFAAIGTDDYWQQKTKNMLPQMNADERGSS